MGINFGIALGAGTKAYVDEAQRVRQNAWEDEQRGQQRQAWQRENARNAAIGNAGNQTVDPSDAQSLSDFLDQNYNFTPDQRDQLAQGIAADPTKASAVLQAYGSYRKSSIGTPVTPPAQAATDDAPQVKAMPQAVPGAGPQPQALPQSTVPGFTTTADPSTQGALPDYTQRGALPAGVALNSPQSQLPKQPVDPGAPKQTTIPGSAAAKAPAPAANAPQPVDVTKPQVNSQGIDLNATHAYLGHDGKVYMASTTPRKLSPGEMQRAIAINLMKLPDAEAVKEGSAMLQQSYATSKEEHDYQVDQIVQQAASSGDIVGALKKLPGVLSSSNLVPGNADAKVAADGKSVTYTLNVPGGKPVVQTITGDNPIDLLAKTAMGLKGMFNPQVYNQATANNLKAQEVLAAQTTAGAHASMAATAALKAPSEINKANAEAADATARGGYYADEGYRARKQGDYYGSGAKNPAQQAEDYAQADVAAHPDKPIAQARIDAWDVIKRNPNANQNKDIPDSLKPLYAQYAQEVGSLNPNAANFNTQRIALQKKYAAFGLDTGYVDPFANIAKKMPKPGGSLFGGDAGRSAPGAPGAGEPPSVKVNPSPQSATPQPSALPQTPAAGEFDFDKAEKYDIPLMTYKRSAEAARDSGNVMAVQGYATAYQQRVNELRKAGTYGR